MLSILRKKASSWIIKVLLGSVAVVFIFFFGSSTLRDQAPGGDIAAVVNGRTITQSMVAGLVNLQKEVRPELKDLPPEMEPFLRGQSLETLVQEEVILGEAEKIGIRIGKDEISAAARRDPRLQNDGKFDAHFFETQFRPGYLNKFGISYEESVARNLTLEHLARLFRAAFFPFPKDEKKPEAPSPTISVKRIILDVKKLGDEKKRDELALTLWPLFISGRLTEDRLKKESLAEEELSDIPLASADRLLDGVFDVEALASLYGLSASKPYPKNPIKASDALYFFKFLPPKNPSGQEDSLIEARSDSAEELSLHFFTKWTEETTSHAKIKR